jgi:hypothetical protein
MGILDRNATRWIQIHRAYPVLLNLLPVGLKDFLLQHLLQLLPGWKGNSIATILH